MYYGALDVARGLIGSRPDTSGLREEEFWAVQDVSLELRRGEALGIIGVNGSGKTTLLRVLAGIIPPDRGEVVSRGRLGALVSLGAGFHSYMTGRENIYLNGVLLGMSRREIDSKLDWIIAFSELEDFIDSPVSTYSSGMRVRLGFSIAVAVRPQTLILDEVLAVGDRVFRAKCFNEMDRLVSQTALILVLHQMHKISRICNRVMVLEGGSVVFADRDVEAGIRFYCSRAGVENSNVTGTGKAVIHNVNLSSGRNPAGSCDGSCDAGDDKPFTIEYLDDLIVEVRFSLDQEIDKATMSMAFFDLEQRQISNCRSNLCRFEIVNHSNERGVRVLFPRLQLVPGIYTITISIHSADSRQRILIRHQGACSFQVVGDFSCPSPFHLQAEWSDL